MKSTEQLYEFMNSNTIGVISTLNGDGFPNAAIVGFGQTKDLCILFGTINSSRKYANLKANPSVAFTIGGETAETIQLEGLAEELLPEELHLVQANYWRKNPHAEAHNANPLERYFLIRPTWIRYTDLRVEPWDVTEVKFDS